MELAPQAKTKIAYGEELLVGGLNWGWNNSQALVDFIYCKNYKPWLYTSG